MLVEIRRKEVCGLRYYRCQQLTPLVTNTDDFLIRMLKGSSVLMKNDSPAINCLNASRLYPTFRSP